MGHADTVAHDPSVADYRATSPRWRAGRNDYFFAHARGAYLK